ncbi:hypothetical protein ACX93W_05085 [Paenibacillus sp. CAU 1782]
MAVDIEIIKAKLMQSYEDKTTVSFVDYDGYAYKGVVTGIDRIFRGFELNDKEWHDPLAIEYLEDVE